MSAQVVEDAIVVLSAAAHDTKTAREVSRPEEHGVASMGGPPIVGSARSCKDKAPADLDRSLQEAERQTAATAPCQANAARSAVRAVFEHVFAGRKHRMKLFVHTIGIARAEMKIGMVNFAYNFNRLAWLTPECAGLTQSIHNQTARRPSWTTTIL